MMNGVQSRCLQSVAHEDGNRRLVCRSVGRIFLSPTSRTGHWPAAVRGGKARLQRSIVVKVVAEARLGYPLKADHDHDVGPENIHYHDGGGGADQTQALDAPLFDMPPGCKVMDMSAMIGGALHDSLGDGA